MRDPRGEQLLEKNVPISRFGGFAIDVPLGEGARLGDYRVEASMPDGAFHERFSVEQYRRRQLRGEGAAAGAASRSPARS